MDITYTQYHQGSPPVLSSSSGPTPTLKSTVHSLLHPSGPHPYRDVSAAAVQRGVLAHAALGETWARHRPACIAGTPTPYLPWPGTSFLDIGHGRRMSYRRYLAGWYFPSTVQFISDMSSLPRRQTDGLSISTACPSHIPSLLLSPPYAIHPDQPIPSPLRHSTHGIPSVRPSPPPSLPSHHRSII